MPTGVYKHNPCTEKTKRKISELVKQQWANGERKGRSRPDMIGNKFGVGSGLTQYRVYYLFAATAGNKLILSAEL